MGNAKESRLFRLRKSFPYLYLFNKSKYSGTPVTQTLKGNKQQCELAVNSSYRVNFSEILIKGREIEFELFKFELSSAVVRLRGTSRLQKIISKERALIHILIL